MPLGSGLTLPVLEGQFRLPDELSYYVQFDAHGDRRNLTQVMRMVQIWTSTLADSPLGRKPRRALADFVKSLSEKGLRSSIAFYDSLSHRLVSTGTLTGATGVTVDGDLLAPDQSGFFVQEFLHTPVSREYIAWRKTGDPKLLTYLYTFTTFLKKAPYKDEALKATAFRGWLKTEDRISKTVLDDVLMRKMKKVLEATYLDRAIYLPMIKFGGGAVASHFGTRVIGAHRKAFHLHFPPAVLQSLQHPPMGLTPVDYYGDSLYGAPGTVMNFHDPGVKLKSRPMRRQNRDATGPRRGDVDVAEQVMVDKNYKTMRRICKEPNDKQASQQAILRNVVLNINDSAIGRSIKLTDQKRNQDAARYGSLTGRVDTIDLSSASDSIKLELVKKVMPPVLRRYLYATRSRFVSTDDGVMSICSFAPMGSANCFTTQCLIFAAIAIVAMSDELHTPNVTDLWKVDDYKRFYDRLALPESKSDNRWDTPLVPLVYGDDIVVDSRATGRLIEYLTAIGFEVNKTKSFMWSQAFRESCGGFYYGGEDVTPVQYRVPIGHVDEPSVVYSLVSQINRLNDYGLHRAASAALRFLKESAEWCRIPFTWDDTVFGIKHLFPRNKHLEVVADGKVGDKIDYQTPIAKVLKYVRITTNSWKHHSWSAYRWYDWWRGRVDSKDDPTLLERGGLPEFIARGDSRTSYRWVSMTCLQPG